MRPPLILAILDGFGEAPSGPGNAIASAEPRFWNELRQQWPVALLEASGESVGLPCGLMGNSEVGHLNIGAGRVVYQEITRIDRAIAEGRFQQNPALLGAIDHARGDATNGDSTNGGRVLHLFGLVAFGHMWAMMAKAAQEKLANGADNASFYENKLAMARFFFERIMPETALLRQRVEAGADSLMALPAEAF